MLIECVNVQHQTVLALTGFHEPISWEFPLASKHLFHRESTLFSQIRAVLPVFPTRSLSEHEAIVLGATFIDEMTSNFINILVNVFIKPILKRFNLLGGDLLARIPCNNTDHFAGGRCL